MVVAFELRARQTSTFINTAAEGLALAGAGYTGWLSVEAFDFAPGPELIARASLAHLRDVWVP